MNHHQSHIGILELDLILLDHLDFLWVDAILLRQVPVGPGIRAQISLLRGHIKEAVMEVFATVDGILLKKVLQVGFYGIGWCRQVFGKENVDGQWFLERGYRLLAGFRK